MNNRHDNIIGMSDKELVGLYKDSLSFMLALEHMIIKNGCDYNFIDNYIKHDKNGIIIEDTASLYVGIVKKHLDDSVNTVEEAVSAVRNHKKGYVKIGGDKSKSIIADVTNGLQNLDNCLLAEIYHEFVLVESGTEYGDVVQCIPLIVKWKITEQDDVLFRIRTEISSILEKHQKTDNKLDIGLIGDGIQTHPWYVTAHQVEFTDDEEFGHILDMEITLQIDWSSF